MNHNSKIKQTFCQQSLIIAAEKYFGVVCRRINLTGDFFLHDEETARDARSPWREVDCLVKAIRENCRSNMEIFDVDASQIPGFADFLKLYEWYSFCRDEIDHHLCLQMSDYLIDGKVPKATKPHVERAGRCWLPNGVLLDNSTIKGRFTAKRAIVGYPRPKQLSSTDPTYTEFIEDVEKNRENRPLESIGAERTIIGHGVYLTNSFLSYGKINFRRADVSGNFSLRYSMIRTPSVHHTILEKIAQGEHHVGYPESYQLNQTINIDGLRVTGNLDLSGCLIEPMCAQQLIEETPHKSKRRIEKSVSIYGSRSVVSGVVLLNNGISFRGSAKFHGSKIGGSFLFEPVLPPTEIESSDFAECEGHDWRLDLTDAHIEKIISVNLITSGLEASRFHEVIAKVNNFVTDAKRSDSGRNKKIKELKLEKNASLARHLEQLSVWLERRQPRHQSKFLELLDEIANQNDRKKKSYGRVDFVNARCGSYSDDFHALRRNWMLRTFRWMRVLPLQYTWAFGKMFTSWPDNIVLDLEGFEYDNFSGRGLDSRLGGQTRIEWLKHQYIDGDPIADKAWLFPTTLWSILLFLSIIAPLPKEIILVLLFAFPVIISMFTVALFAVPKEFLFRRKSLRPRIYDKRKQGQKWHGYKSQPWLHCAATLRNSGREEAARRVRLSRERIILFSRKIYPFERIFRAVLLLLFGRGLVRSYPVMWFLAIFSVAWFLYDLSFKSNLMRPSEPVVLIEMAEHGALNRDPTLPPPGYETPRAYVFAFERMTPGMPFTHENRWAACAPEHIAAAEIMFLASTRSHPADAEIPKAPLPLCFPTRKNFFTDALAANVNHFSDRTNMRNALSTEDIKSICNTETPQDADETPPENTKSAPLKELCAGLNQPAPKESELLTFEPSDTSFVLRHLKKIPGARRIIGRLDEFLKEGGARISGWAFLSYGWLLVAGFAISISQLLLKED